MPQLNSQLRGGRDNKRCLTTSRVGGIKFKLVLLTIIVGLVLVVWPNTQLLADMILAHNVQLGGELGVMAGRLELTERADLILRASEPQLQTKQQFNQNCQRKEATAFILGCYNGRNIFVYQVNNQELAGISEVTLAHELLHAVYRRMTPQQRTHINQLLVTDYNRVKTSELEQRMKLYQRTQPGEFENELHSILGTEFAGLSEELEQHYRQIFKNRQAIVAMNQASQRPFWQKQQLLDNLKTEITNDEASLKQRQVEHEQAVRAFNAEVVKFNQRASMAGGFQTQAEFQARRAELASLQAQLRQRQSQLTTAITQLNQKIDQYNQTNLAMQELNRSLDSLDTPQLPNIGAN